MKTALLMMKAPEASLPSIALLLRARFCPLRLCLPFLFLSPHRPLLPRLKRRPAWPPLPRRYLHPLLLHLTLSRRTHTSSPLDSPPSPPHRFRLRPSPPTHSTASLSRRSKNLPSPPSLEPGPWSARPAPALRRMTTGPTPALTLTRLMMMRMSVPAVAVPSSLPASCSVPWHPRVL